MNATSSEIATNRDRPIDPPTISDSKAEKIAGTPDKKSPNRRGLLLRAAAVVGGLIVIVFGVKLTLHALRTVSTDDAYVNSYVTFIAPRVSGQVTEVLVEDNNRVKKGDVLVRLDPEPFQIAVAAQQAALDVAQADLELARANTQALIAQTRGDRFKLANSMEVVDDQVAQIQQRVASLEKARATLILGQQEYRRGQDLLAKKVISEEDMDQKRADLGVAEAAVAEALENVHESRVALGLPAEPPAGQALGEVPANLDQTYSVVRETLADLLQSAAQLGVSPSSYDLTPQQAIEEFYRQDPAGDIDRIYSGLLKTAPAVKQAEAAVEQAQRALDQANLNLRYCTIVSEIDGVVTRRNVNPGDYLQVGQSLMAVRSLDQIWVDANFKETQLRDLRIGQRATLRVDMYGGSRTFEGRVSGFTMGTGSTLALLPAENATGNFVKVVQRLPVRIDLINYDPNEAPLFVGTSVEPEVDIRSKPSGPDAGKFLQSAVTEPAARP
jgi:membrane fusion protein (multidrug efflux system)